MLVVHIYIYIYIYIYKLQSRRREETSLALDREQKVESLLEVSFLFVLVRSCL
jgi:hypothetical protein